MNEIDSFLLQYLLNELNQEERIKVETWIRENPENLSYFEGFRKTHIQVSAALQSDNICKRYPEIRHQIRQRTLFLTIRRLAAIVILVLGGSICVYLTRQESPSPIFQEAQTSIQPGSSKAILHLSSGRKVQLDSMAQNVNESDGTTIHISENGTIDYSESAQQTNITELSNRLEIPRGGEFKISLSDGTEIWLNAESEIQYPTTFIGKERRVKLKGEAYFKVAKNPDHPFIVQVGDLDVKVYGTEFNMSTQNEGIVETVLVEGSISVINKGKEILLKPRQKAEFIPSCGQITVTNINVLPYIAWKDGNFMFHNESLESIMNKLARWYDTDVFYIHPEAKTIRLSGIMERYDDIRELLRYFEKISEARFTIKGKTISINIR